MKKKADTNHNSPNHTHQKDDVNLSEIQNKIEKIESQGTFVNSHFNFATQRFGEFIPPSSGRKIYAWKKRKFWFYAFWVFLYLTAALHQLLQSFIE